MPEDGFENVCVEVTGLDLGDFFDASVRGTGELPLQKLLSKFGIDYHLRRASNAKDKGGQARKEAGGNLAGGDACQQSRKNLFSRSSQTGGPAELAGVAPG